jgi:hypothetical protein
VPAKNSSDVTKSHTSESVSTGHRLVLGSLASVTGVNGQRNDIDRSVDNSTTEDGDNRPNTYRSNSISSISTTSSSISVPMETDNRISQSDMYQSSTSVVQIQTQQLHGTVAISTHINTEDANNTVSNSLEVLNKYRELLIQKKEVKRRLKKFDEDFALRHNRQPKKSDKEVCFLIFYLLCTVPISCHTLHTC